MVGPRNVQGESRFDGKRAKLGLYFGISKLRFARLLVGQTRRAKRRLRR